MVGYLKDKRVGALTYNLAHNLVFSIAIVLIGFLINYELLIFAGLILSAHVGLDRTLGFGLKDSTGFKTTHLGKIK